MKVLLLCCVLISLLALIEGNRRRKTRKGCSSTESKLRRLVRPRVVRGQDVLDGEFPEVVQVVFFDKDSQFKGHCTGVIIDKDMVLTAAHCANWPHNFILTGTDHVASWGGQVDYKVVQKCIHPNYGLCDTQRKRVCFDYAIMRVHKNFVLSRTVGIALLPQRELEIGKSGTFVGAGATKFLHNGTMRTSTKLQKFEVKVVECPEEDRHKSLACFFDEVNHGSVCYGQFPMPTLIYAF